MTFELLSKIIEENNIPKDVRLLSDSGWECFETEMNGVWYNKSENLIIFTQNGDLSDSQFKDDDWELIFGDNVLCAKCKHIDEYEYCMVRKTSYFDGQRNMYVPIEKIKECDYFEEKGE